MIQLKRFFLFRKISVGTLNLSRTHADSGRFSRNRANPQGPGSVGLVCVQAAGAAILRRSASELTASLRYLKYAILHPAVRATRAGAKVAAAAPGKPGSNWSEPADWPSIAATLSLAAASAAAQTLGRIAQLVRRVPDKDEVSSSNLDGPLLSLARSHRSVVRWGCSSIDRAPRLQRGGYGFESRHLHSKPGFARAFFRPASRPGRSAFAGATFAAQCQQSVAMAARGSTILGGALADAPPPQS